MAGRTGAPSRARPLYTAQPLQVCGGGGGPSRCRCEGEGEGGRREGGSPVLITGLLFRPSPQDQLQEREDTGAGVQMGGFHNLAAPSPSYCRCARS